MYFLIVTLSAFALACLFLSLGRHKSPNDKDDEDGRECDGLN